MTKTLERDLGLPAVVAISMGAMVGSGIFILPALAYEIVGPAVVLVYVLAGLLVLPAALSQSELATAMPKAGGAYLYIERGLGPLVGTVAGLGTWFSLTFKSALALVGGVPYVLLLVSVPEGLVTPLALALATVLVGLNLLGAKQTGLTQVAVVAVMLAALVWFVAGGLESVTTEKFSPFVEGDSAGLLAAIGLVFVSYAGVTKVASVAEEIERPERNVPLGIVGSLVVTTLLYALIVAVMVGVVPGPDLAGSTTPMADAARATLGDGGVLAVVGAAVLALVSTANAGVLSASRYPFAMARDRLVPRSFGAVSDRFGTPSRAIVATGVVTLVLVAFVPIAEIAKLASAFQFLVFALVNVAVIVFREGSADYDPTFRSPLYPWMQLFGAGTSLLLVTQMGPVPLLGALAIVVAAATWYLLYARRRGSHSGVLADLLRRRLASDPATPASVAGPGGLSGRGEIEHLGSLHAHWPAETEWVPADAPAVLVAPFGDTTPDTERSLLTLAADLARPLDGRVAVARFEQADDPEFERRVEDLAAELGVTVRCTAVGSHDDRRAVVDWAADSDADLLVVGEDRRRPPLGGTADWVVDHAPCDVLVVEGGPYGRPQTVHVEDGAAGTVATVADRVATETGSRLVSQSPTAAPRDTDDSDDGTASREVAVRAGRRRRLVGGRAAPGPATGSLGPTTLVVYPRGTARTRTLRLLLARARRLWTRVRPPGRRRGPRGGQVG